MKITYKELRCNKNDDTYTIITRCIRRYLPEVELVAIRNITNICNDAYRVTADLAILNRSVKQAIFRAIIPTDMRKNILFMPFYSKTVRNTTVDKTIKGSNIILSIKECYRFDTLNFEDKDNIVIREDTIRFRVKPHERVLEDYYSLYIDSKGIIRLHNRDDIRDDITYIYADIEPVNKTTLYPGYVKKSVYCKGMLSYRKSDHILVNKLVHNSCSTRYCLRCIDKIYMPERYMNYVRDLLNINKWG